MKDYAKMDLSMSKLPAKQAATIQQHRSHAPRTGSLPAILAKKKMMGKSLQIKDRFRNVRNSQHAVEDNPFMTTNQRTFDVIEQGDSASKNKNHYKRKTPFT